MGNNKYTTLNVRDSTKEELYNLIRYINYTNKTDLSVDEFIKLLVERKNQVEVDKLLNNNDKQPPR